MACISFRVFFLIIFFSIFLLQYGTVLSLSSDRPLLIVSHIILNQKQQLHKEKAYQLSDDLNKQSNTFPSLEISSRVASDYFTNVQYFALFPLLPELCTSTADWHLLTDEYVTIDLSNLLKIFEENHGQGYIGRALQDASHTIIHHFDDPKDGISFPDLRAGVILSKDAVSRVCAVLPSSNSSIVTDQMFFIDPSYELSAWLKKHVQLILSPSDRLCVNHSLINAEHCGITSHLPRICKPDDRESSTIHVAIKTHAGNHDSRLPVLLATWLPDAPSYTLYSDVQVQTELYSTRATGIANSERGHCAKTLAILKLTLSENNSDWLLLADDDTLVSMPRLKRLLSCYPSSEPLALGEVYGFRGPHSNTILPYQTGGSGMVFSRPMIEALTLPGACYCGADDPDDMVIGSCIARLGHSIINVYDMHQNGPDSYADDLLFGSVPISFHRFWNVDPVKVYREWLLENKKVLSTHEEL